MADTNSDQQSRVVQLTGAANFRDFGGYANSDGRQVKLGMLYRSDELTRLTQEDVPKMNSLGLNRIIDLRQKLEIQRTGFDTIYTENETKYDFRHFVYGDPYLMEAQVSIELAWDMKQVDFPSLYVNILEQNREGITQVFERFTDPSQYPVLVHCNQGKDRAGVISALVLLFLEIPEATVLDDYMLTSQLVDTERKLIEMQEYMQEFSGDLPHGTTADDWRPMLSCLPEAMENLFGHIEIEYNGVTNFLNSVGIDSEKQETIRNILLCE